VALGKGTATAVLGALALGFSIVAVRLYFVVRPLVRTRRAGGADHNAPAWFGGPSYQELRPADRLAMAGIRSGAVVSLVAVLGIIGATMVSVAVAGFGGSQGSGEETVTVRVGDRVSFPQTPFPDPFGLTTMRVITVRSGPDAATRAQVQVCAASAGVASGPGPGDFQLRLAGQAQPVTATAGAIPGPISGGQCAAGPITFVAPAGSVPVSVVFPELGAERTYVWTIPEARG